MSHLSSSAVIATQLAATLITSVCIRIPWAIIFVNIASSEREKENVKIPHV